MSQLCDPVVKKPNSTLGCVNGMPKLKLETREIMFPLLSDCQVGPGVLYLYSRAAVPNLLAPGTVFIEDHFYMDLGRGDGFRMI